MTFGTALFFLAVILFYSEKRWSDFVTLRKKEMKIMAVTRTELVAGLDALLTQTQEKFDKVLDLIKDGNDAIINLYLKIDAGGDFTAELNKVKDVSQKNIEMVAAIESADAQLEVEKTS